MVLLSMASEDILRRLYQKDNKNMFQNTINNWEKNIKDRELVYRNWLIMCIFYEKTNISPTSHVFRSPLRYFWFNTPSNGSLFHMNES